MYKLYLGLGSNLGDRANSLRDAVELLGETVRITAVSPVYETAAWGVTDQPDFLNQCLAAESDMPPWPMLRFVKWCERSLGRKETFRWGPRTIDIDILLYEELVVRSARLNVPHAGMAKRASVLVPLNDIAPDLRHPHTGLTVAELAARVDKSGIQTVS